MKAIVYYRMSSDQQTDSIERQKSEVEPVVEREGDDVLAVYVDKGKSGSKDREKRIDFLRMMRDVERGSEAEKLYLWDLARFTRENPFKAAKFYALLMDHDILIHDVKMGVIDLKTAQGRMIINMMQETNHAYSTTISENTTSGRRRLLSQGWWVAGSIPYGYMRRYIGPGGDEAIHPRNHKGFQKPRGWHLALAVNEDEAEIVNAIFRMYLQEDTSIRAIARWLNENGVALPLVTNRRAGKTALQLKSLRTVPTVDTRILVAPTAVTGTRKYSVVLAMQKCVATKFRKSSPKRTGKRPMRNDDSAKNSRAIAPRWVICKTEDVSCYVV